MSIETRGGIPPPTHELHATSPSASKSDMRTANTEPLDGFAMIRGEFAMIRGEFAADIRKFAKGSHSDIHLSLIHI